MNNEQREAVYLRDRSTLTPAQQRRIRKRGRQVNAPIKRSILRRARRDVVRSDAHRRASIRAAFRGWRR